MKMFGGKRRKLCPQCGERVIQCRYTGDYCEECGWPESDFDEEGKQMEEERAKVPPIKDAES